jgi:hypothetical protein
LDNKGADGHEVAEFDAALFKARTSIREQVAKELGQYDDKSNAPLPSTIQIVYVDKMQGALDSPAIEVTHRKVNGKTNGLDKS